MKFYSTRSALAGFVACFTVGLSQPSSVLARDSAAPGVPAPAEKAAAEKPASPAAKPAAPVPATTVEEVTAAVVTAPKPKVIREARKGMGSDLYIMVYSANTEDAKKAMAAAFDEMALIEKSMSEWIAESDVSRINSAAGSKEPVTISARTLAVLKSGKEVNTASKGKFSMSWAAFAPLWDFRNIGDQNKILPTEGKALEKAELVDDSLLTIDETASTAMLGKSGMALGLGGIAKGYALDRAIKVLTDAGFGDALIFAGGDIKTSGSKGGKPWLVGIQDPRAQGFFAVVSMSKGGAESIVNSGDYEHFFEQDGKRYHHIIDPRTGFPATLSRSVTVISADALRADAFSTALFIMGPVEGMALVEATEGLEAIIVGANNEVVMSTGLKGRVRLVKEPTK